MALNDLKGQGYSVEVINLARFDLVPEALARGDVDVGSVSPQSGWAAVAKGAKLRSIVEQFGVTWSIVTKQEIKTCEDLNNRGVGFSGTRGVNQSMLDAYVKKHCPGTKPQILVAGDSNGRTAAMLSGQLDAALLEIDQLLELNRQAPGRFHALIHSSQEFPNVLISVFSVRPDWAQQNPQLLKAFIRALLQANRRVNENAQALRDEIVKRLSMESGAAQAAADAYLAERVWDSNGGLTNAKLQTTLDFLVETGNLQPGLKVEDVADLSYLNAVLDEIGRK
jgi:ABC-type nitrate/sulfonate/bicarbonate transport system substrate-binding protein